jgi:hypothetical protein
VRVTTPADRELPYVFARARCHVFIFVQNFSRGIFLRESLSLKSSRSFGTVPIGACQHRCQRPNVQEVLFLGRARGSQQGRLLSLLAGRLNGWHRWEQFQNFDYFR